MGTIALMESGYDGDRWQVKPLEPPAVTQSWDIGRRGGYHLRDEVESNGVRIHHYIADDDAPMPGRHGGPDAIEAARKMLGTIGAVRLRQDIECHSSDGSSARDLYDLITE